MARLPTVGGDSDSWGTVLNEFLEVAHNSDGTVMAAEVTDLLLPDGATVEQSGSYLRIRQPISTFLEFTEMTEPAAPSANGARLYVKDNGSGKTQLCVRFSSGAVQVIATQP